MCVLYHLTCYHPTVYAKSRKGGDMKKDKEEIYYVVMGLILDGFPSIRRSAGITLIYDDAEILEEEWPDAEYIEIIGTPIEGIDA